MKRASVLYEEGEYFVPELIVCSDAMYAGIEEFQKYLPDTEKQSIGKVAIGVVEGDTHDIGKNLVRIMLETGGFDVYDLGRDVALDTLWIMYGTMMWTFSACLPDDHNYAGNGEGDRKIKESRSSR